MKRNRWTVLAGLSLCNLCMGASYIWSVFYLPLVESHQWSMSSVSLAYSLMLLCAFGGGLLSARLQSRLSAKWIMLAAAFMWGGGWCLTGFATEIWELYLFFGVIAGTGTGLGYNTIMATVPRWFPDRLGLANGLVTGSAGFAPILFAPVSYALLSSHGVNGAFHVVGLVFLAGMCIAVCFVDTPRTSAGQSKPLMPPTERDKSTAQMLHDPVFYLMWFVLAAGCTAGMMFSGHAGSIGQNMLHMSADGAALSVSALAVGSVAGRILAGVLSDRLGRFRVLVGLMVIIIADMLWLLALDVPGAFLLSVMVIGFSYGSLMAVYPTVCVDLFGYRNQASNWSVLFSGMTCASLLGPTVAALCVERSGSYRDVFWQAALLAALGLAVLFIARRRAGDHLK